MEKMDNNKMLKYIKSGNFIVDGNKIYPEGYEVMQRQVAMFNINGYPVGYLSSERGVVYVNNLHIDELIEDNDDIEVVIRSKNKKSSTELKQLPDLYSILTQIQRFHQKTSYSYIRISELIEKIHLNLYKEIQNYKLQPTDDKLEYINSGIDILEKTVKIYSQYETEDISDTLYILTRIVENQFRKERC